MNGGIQNDKKGKRKMCLLFTMMLVFSLYSVPVLAAQESEDSTNLFNDPVQGTMQDDDGNVYTVVGQCFEMGTNMNIVGADTICECYQYADNSAAGKAAAHNKGKTLEIYGAGVATLSGTLNIPDVRQTKTGRAVSVRSQISGVPYIKTQIAAGHRVTVGSKGWMGHSFCNLI